MNKLRLFLFPDTGIEEEACIRACVLELQKSFSIEEVRVGRREKGFFKKNKSSELSWIVSKDWQGALDYLAAFSAKSKIFVSVLSNQSRKLSLWETWYQSLHRVIPANIKLLAHSPLSYRFLKELAGMPDLQLEQLPFPVPTPSFGKKQSAFTVGAYGSFVPNNNLHFLLTVGHYLAKKDRTIQLKLWGQGPLSQHLVQLARDLGLEEQVHIIPSSSSSPPEFCDVSLYFPHRNDHFGSLLMAASVGAVPICGKIPGIERYVTDSVNGFVFDSEETRSIAELILSLKNHPYLCQQMGAQFKKDVFKNFSIERVSEQYLSLMNGN
ncbi:glycosyltransferase, partial [bacterium]|nr:glycosyltransferase [bacterium]